MHYKKIFILFFFIFLTNCTTVNFNNKKIKTNFNNNFSNKGFALIYNVDLYTKKIVSKKMNETSYTIFQKDLKRNTTVKITNLLNKKTLIAKVGNKSSYPIFNNSVITPSIAKELKLDPEQPYIEIVSMQKNSVFIAKKAKTYDEEKQVATTAPVSSISINDLNTKKNIPKKRIKKKFSYLINIADFYFEKSAKLMINRIKEETSITNVKLKKLSKQNYRVYLGPFNNINSLQKSYNDIDMLGFENIQIIKND